MPWALLDTNVYIGHWEKGLFQDDLEQILRAHIVRHSSVVLSELRRGARTAEARARVEELRRVAPIEWAPLSDDWWEAGDLVRRTGDERGWDINKRREFQNDALIALTARRHGAAVVTANRVDFELLARAVKLRLIVL